MEYAIFLLANIIFLILQSTSQNKYQKMANDDHYDDCF